MIAHRLSQAATCDRVIVMEHGHITDPGTHPELLKADGAYATLWSAWQESRTTLPTRRRLGSFGTVCPAEDLP